MLEEIVEEIQGRVRTEDRPESAAGWLDLLFRDGLVDRLIALPENEQFRGIRPRFNASLDSAIDVDYLEMIQRWVGGEELDAIADSMLGAVTDADYRADVITEFVSAVFEHHLPWILRIMVSWANIALPDEHQMPLALPLHLQHGVATPSALELMTNGVRSRRLATRVAQVLGEDEPESIRERLRNMTIDLWRQTFDAAPTELRDLLSYVHDPTLKPASRLLGGDPIGLDLNVAAGVVLAASVEVRLRQENDGPEPRAWIAESAAGPLGQAAASAHMSLETLTNLGIPLTVVASASDGLPKLTVTMSET